MLRGAPAHRGDSVSSNVRQDGFAGSIGFMPDDSPDDLAVLCDHLVLPARAVAMNATESIDQSVQMVMKLAVRRDAGRHIAGASYVFIGSRKLLQCLQLYIRGTKAGQHRPQRAVQVIGVIDELLTWQCAPQLVQRDVGARRPDAHNDVITDLLAQPQIGRGVDHLPD